MICRLIGVGSRIYHNNSELLGFEMLLASLERAGIKGEIIYFEFDANISINEFCKKYNWENIALVGFSPFYTTIKVINDIITHLKRINANLLFCAGGAAVSHASIECLEQFPGLDIVIRGEGEITVCDLAKKIINGEDWRDCEGITYKHENRIKKNKDRPVIENLDDLEWANRVMLSTYNAGKARIQTARGCEGNCTFCAESRVFNLERGKIEWRGRSPKNIVNELAFINNQYGINFFSIVDESFEDPASGIGLKRIEKISDEIINREMDIYFEVLMRVENILKVPIKTWEKLKKAGLVSVLLGIESGSNDALKTYGKIANVQQNYAAYKFLFDTVGINVIAGFIMFNPYSTLNEFKENIVFIKNLNLQYSFRIFSNRVHIFYNTPLYNRIRRDKLLLKEYDLAHPTAYRFVNKDIDRIASRIDYIISIVDQHGSGEYITDYYHDTYERIVMYEKKGDLSIAKSLKEEMWELRIKMGNYVLEIFEMWDEKEEVLKREKLIEIMNKYEVETLRKCNSILKKILKLQ